jgi:hypothetical protein
MLTTRIGRKTHSSYFKTRSLSFKFTSLNMPSLMARYVGGGQRGIAAIPLSPEYTDRSIDEIPEDI